MRIKLSSSREELAKQLFLEIDRARSTVPVPLQVVVVPDGGLRAWLLMAAAFAKVSVLDIELKIVGEPYTELSFCHYFGFREITFQNNNAQIWYLFSPCGHFWSDLLSERELGRKVARTKLVARNVVQEALESFYSETNSLLSNAAILGRKTAQAIEELSGEVEASYPVTAALLEEKVYQERLYDNTLFIPENDEVTLLRRIQADLIFLVGSRKEKEPIAEDGSIRIVEAPTLRSEVSALAEGIQELSRSRPIGLGDVLVLTPTPSLYEPVLKDLLPTCTVQSLYDEDSLLVQRLQGWFDCIQSRFDKNDLIALASLPEMGSVLECDEEEMSELRGALSSAQLTWGVSGPFRKRWLALQCIQAKDASLHEETVQALFQGKLQALFEKEEIRESLDSSWKSLLRYLSLVERLALVWEAPIATTRVEILSFWLQKVERTLEELKESFSTDDLQVLSSTLFSLSQREMQYGVLSIASFFDLFLREVRFKVKNTPQVVLGHVLLGSLLETIPIPARYIAFLGMGEEEVRSFISKESERSMVERSLLQDRLNYAVLDGMMQTKERVLFSYIGWDFELRQHKEPGAIVTLIESYIQEQFCVERIRHQKNIMFSKKKSKCHSATVDLLPLEMPSRMDVGTFVFALADPLSYYMKQMYGHRYLWKNSAETALFAPMKQLERLVEKELTSKPMGYTRAHARGISSGLLEKELHEMKEVCKRHLEPYFGIKLPEPVHYAIEELAKKPVCSLLKLEGTITVYPPFASIVVAADLERVIMEGLWAKLTVLSLLKNDLQTVFCAVQGVQKELLAIDASHVERFFEAMVKQPFPFHAELLPKLIGSRASFTAFEEALQEKIKEGDPLCMSFALLGTKEEREESYPIWKEHAERLISPWIEWGASL